MSRRKAAPTPMTDLLRRKIDECGVSFVKLAEATGIQRMSLMRFAKGQTSLRLDVAERLAAYFGLELRERG